MTNRWTFKIILFAVLAAVLASVAVAHHRATDRSRRDRLMASLRADLAIVDPPAGATWISGDSSSHCVEVSDSMVPPFTKQSADDGTRRRWTDGRPELDPARFDHVAYAEAVRAEMEAAGFVGRGSSESNGGLSLAWSRGRGSNRRTVQLLAWPHGAHVSAIFDAAMCQ
jgi:hypothetical protein